MTRKLLPPIPRAKDEEQYVGQYVGVLRDGTVVAHGDNLEVHERLVALGLAGTALQYFVHPPDDAIWISPGAFFEFLPVPAE